MRLINRFDTFSLLEFCWEILTCVSDRGPSKEPRACIENVTVTPAVITCCRGLTIQLSELQRAELQSVNMNLNPQTKMNTSTDALLLRRFLFALMTGRFLIALMKEIFLFTPPNKVILTS